MPHRHSATLTSLDSVSTYWTPNRIPNLQSAATGALASLGRTCCTVATGQGLLRLKRVRGANRSAQTAAAWCRDVRLRPECSWQQAAKPEPKEYYVSRCLSDLMAAAERGRYAVGYFESWNLESLLAVADAAEATRSPVILGWSGIFLPHPDRAARDSLSPYAALGLDVCRQIDVPACLLFNESPNLDWVLESVDLGFGLTMFADEERSSAELIEPVRQVVAYAHAAGVAVEAEMASPPGLSASLDTAPADLHLTDPAAAAAYVAATGIDALAVNVGQVHLHGRDQVAA